MTLDELKARRPDVVAKVESDRPTYPPTLGGRSIKDELVTALLPLAATSIDNVALETFYDSFRSRFELLGEDVDLRDLERLGHVISMRGFSDYIADPWLRRSATAVPTFGSIGYPPSRPLSDPVLREVLLGLRGDDLVHSGGGTIWCFRGSPPSEEPFNGERVELLPCRLGLRRDKETVIEPRWIAFPVIPPPTAWKAPTFADTSWRFLPDWMPGGFTAQSPDYNCGPGFPEVIGKGVRFSQLMPAIGPFVGEWPRLGHVTPP